MAKLSLANDATDTSFAMDNPTTSAQPFLMLVLEALRISFFTRQFPHSRIVEA
jgi:hypothetical protein